MAKYYKKYISRIFSKRVVGLLVLICFAVLYNAYQWYQENIVLFWSVVAVILCSVVLFMLFKWRKKRKTLADMPERVKDIKMLLDEFVTDIPKFSKHSETNYQIDFGRYLKDRLSGSAVVYEKTKDGARPDIVVDEVIAIEIKALKDPNTQENREYNSEHVDSIFKKIHTYRVYDEVVIIIFNADYVKDRNWGDYKKMKEAVEQEGVILFEK